MLKFLSTERDSALPVYAGKPGRDWYSSVLTRPPGKGFSDSF